MQGFTLKQIQCQRFLNLRYDGTDVPIMTPCPPNGDYVAAFREAYQVRAWDRAGVGWW
jgi:5-oxoprolinase (ATP-hydrolysing)